MKNSMYDKPCKEIFKLKRMLEKAKIPFEFIESFGYNKSLLSAIAPDLLEHYHICYPSRGKGQRISVVEGFGTHGREQDKLEIMGGLTPYEQFCHGDSPIGYLTAANVFKRIKKDNDERKLKEYEEDSKRS